MKTLLFLALGVTSFHSFATPECDFWKSEISALENQISQAEARLKTCSTTRTCKDLEFLIESLEEQKESYEQSVESFCE
jgi:hypothetical protein